MTIRATARRRISLLASSSLMASTLLAGAGGLIMGALTPSQALAACTVFHPTSNDFICTGFEGNHGFSFPAYITVTEQHVDGLTIGVFSTAGPVGFSMDVLSNIKHVGPGDALTLSTFSGDISTVTPNGSGIAGIITNDTGRGIVFTNGFGSVTADVSADVTSAGNAIDVTGAGNAIHLTTSGNITTSAGKGVVITTTSGSISLDVSGDVSTTGGRGLDIKSATGNVDLTLTGATITTSPTFRAVAIDTGGSAKVDVDSATTLTGSGGGYDLIIEADSGVALNFDGKSTFGGVFLGSDGDITMTGAGSIVDIGAGAFPGLEVQNNGAAGKTTITTGAVTGTGDGVKITSVGAGLVTLVTNGVVTGDSDADGLSNDASADGIDIKSAGGVSLTINAKVVGDPAVTVLDNSAIGINAPVNADALGTAGGVILTELGTGPVTAAIANNATVNGDTDADLSGDGVDITATIGAVKLTSTAGTKITGGQGVVIFVTDAPVTVNTAGSVTGTAGSGIFVFETSALGTGDIDITANGPIAATAWGINALAQGANDIKIVTGPGGDITGPVVGIQAFASKGGTIDIDASGDIGDALAPTLNGIQAITASTAEVTIGVHGDILTSGDAVLDLGAGGHTSVTTTAGSDINSKLGTGILVAGFKDADLVADGNVSGGLGGILAFVTNDVSLDYSGDITATAAAGKGVWLQSSGGDIDIERTTTVGGVISAGQVGIYAETSGAGHILMGGNNHQIGAINGAQAAGIETHAAAGVTDVALKGVIEGTAARGVFSTSTTGQIFVEIQAGGIGSAANGADLYGVFAQSTGPAAGGVAVFNVGKIYTDPTGVAAIWAEGGGTGGTFVQALGLTQGPVGIHAQGDASGIVTVLQTTKTASTIGFAGDGIEAISLGTGTVNVGGPLPFDLLLGSVTGTQATTASAAQGILARGVGDVNVFTGAGSTVQVLQTPASPATPLLGTSFGIFAQSNPGAAGAGGAVKIDVGGAVSGGSGILASANGFDATDTVSINVGAAGVVTGATGFGVRALSQQGIAISVAAGGKLFGLGADPSRAVISTDIAPGKLTTITNAGTISSLSAAPAVWGDLAFFHHGGSVSVTNTATGLINGRLDASLAAGPITVTNTGIWHTSGGSTFSGGVDSVTNSGSFVAGDATASTTTLAALETFANAGGSIFLGSTNNTSTDNQANDRLIMTGTAFTGSGASKLLVDADLFSTAQASCAAPLTAADCLQIGSSAGVTAIVVNDTNAHPFGAFNTGITLVQGSSAASHFVLSSASEFFNAGGTNEFGGATDVLNKPGLFFYDLVFDSNRHLLISVPKLAAFQFAQLGGAFSGVWSTSTASWFDRQADLRDTIEGRSAGGAPGVWMKVVGDWTRRSGTNSVTLLGNTYTFNVGYNQDTALVTAGIDFLNVQQANQAWVLGVQGGYIDTNLRFKGSSSRINAQGTSLGVYGTYVLGGFFLDGIINGNFLSMDVSMPSLGVATAPWTTSGDVRTWGGQLEGGYQWPIGAASFVEPVASLSYSRTSFDDLPIPGGTQLIDDTDSFKGSLGLRLGTTASYQYYKLKVALEGRVWDEFDGDTHTTLVIPAGADFTNVDELDGGIL